MKPYKIRPATWSDCEAIARIHVKAWQESYINIVSKQSLKNLSFDERLALRKTIMKNEDDKCIHLVAIVNDMIVGFCDAGPAFVPSPQYSGEIYAIYLLERYKRCGIGSALLQSAKNHLTQKNLLPFIISVLKENKVACDFYEKQGGQLLGEETVCIDDRSYPENVYIF